jgi:hypothetical protein
MITSCDAAQTDYRPGGCAKLLGRMDGVRRRYPAVSSGGKASSSMSRVLDRARRGAMVGYFKSSS